MTARKRDYSREDMSWAVGLANKGHDAHLIGRVLATKPSGKRGQPYSMKYQRLLDERGRDAADRYARRTARRAVEFVKANPPIRDPGDAVATLIGITRAADEHDWSKASGARKALEAAVRLGVGLGSVSFGLSLRQWAELAGMSRRTLEHARSKLLDLGWAALEPGRTSGGSLRYRLRAPRDSQTSDKGTVFLTGGGETVPRHGCWAYPQTPDPAHDCYRPGALGPGAWLSMLEVLRHAYYWPHRIMPPPFPPIPRAGMDGSDDVAHRLGTLGEGARDRRIHEDERAAFAEGSGGGGAHV